MKRTTQRALMLGAIALVAAAGYAGVAAAQGQVKIQAQAQSTPKGWNYEIKNGKRVPKASSRVTNADGSWREEIRQGKCVTIKEKSAAGEYKESRSCDD